MLNRERAVSEVIASLILLLIVSILGTSLYSYTLTATGFQQDALQGEVQREAERAQERFTVIAVWWSGSGDLLNLTVLNYGKLDLKIVDIYVNGERTTDFQTGHGEEMHNSKWRKISFNSPAPIFADTIYEIVVVSERGVSYVYNWEP